MVILLTKDQYEIHISFMKNIKDYLIAEIGPFFTALIGGFQIHSRKVFL